MSWDSWGWAEWAWSSSDGFAALLASIGALLWHSDGTDDHLVDQDGDILT